MAVLIDAATRQRAEQIVEALDLSDLDAFIDITDDIAEILADAGFTALAQVGVSDASDLVNQVNDRAVKYAEARAADLVTQIEETTREFLRDTIASGLADNLGSQEIIERIAAGAGFSDARAALIATTEIAMANSQGALDGYRDARDSGVAVRKRWLTAGDDKVDEDVCLPNEEAGDIDLDEAFPSGDDAPPGHPNCRCALAPVVGEDANDAGDDSDE